MLSAPDPSGHGSQFADRRDAGRQLAQALRSLVSEDPVVVALPRGGLPLAKEVSITLAAPLEILAVRKLGAPHNPEYGIGAIVEDGSRLIDSEAVAALGIAAGDLEAIVRREKAELSRRVDLYRRGRVPLDLKDKTVVVVDDGVATGITDRAALRALRRQEPKKLILAVPVCAPDSAPGLRAEADELVSLLMPPMLLAVGEWYRDFSQISDQDVVSILDEFPRHDRLSY